MPEDVEQHRRVPGLALGRRRVGRRDPTAATAGVGSSDPSACLPPASRPVDQEQRRRIIQPVAQGASRPPGAGGSRPPVARPLSARRVAQVLVRHHRIEPHPAPRRRAAARGRPRPRRRRSRSISATRSPRPPAPRSPARRRSRPPPIGKRSETHRLRLLAGAEGQAPPPCRHAAQAVGEGLQGGPWRIGAGGVHCPVNVWPSAAFREPPRSLPISAGGGGHPPRHLDAAQDQPLPPANRTTTTPHADPLGCRTGRSARRTSAGSGTNAVAFAGQGDRDRKPPAAFAGSVRRTRQGTGWPHRSGEHHPEPGAPARRTRRDRRPAATAGPIAIELPQRDRQAFAFGPRGGAVVQRRGKDGGGGADPRSAHGHADAERQRVPHRGSRRSRRHRRPPTANRVARPSR